MNTYKINDSIFDALFRQAVIESVERKVRALPAEDELKDIIFSERHEKRMEKLFSSSLRKSRIAKAAKFARRAAAVILIVSTFLFGALMTSQDVRATVVNTIVQWFEQFDFFTSDQADEPTAIILPSYMPEGFTDIQSSQFRWNMHLKLPCLSDDYIRIIYIQLKESIKVST